MSQALPYHAIGQARSLDKGKLKLIARIRMASNDHPPNPRCSKPPQSSSLSGARPSLPSNGPSKRLVHLRPAVQVSNVPDPTQPRNPAKPGHSAKAGPGLTQNTENLGTSHQISVCPSGSLSKPPIQRVICIRRSVRISNLPSRIPGPTLPRNRDKLDHSTRAESGLAQRS